MTKLESDGAASPVTAVEPAPAAPAPARANEATTEIEEIATEHMEICMEVNFPESISLEAGVTSSQLAPHVRDGIRSDAASAVERLRAAGAWQCESCGAAGNEPWQPCKCGKKKPVRAMEGSLRTAVKALSGRHTRTGTCILKSLHHDLQPLFKHVSCCQIALHATGDGSRPGPES